MYYGHISCIYIDNLASAKDARKVVGDLQKRKKLTNENIAVFEKDNIYRVEGYLNTSGMPVDFGLYGTQLSKQYPTIEISIVTFDIGSRTNFHWRMYKNGKEYCSNQKVDWVNPFNCDGAENKDWKCISSDDYFTACATEIGQDRIILDDDLPFSDFEAF